MSQETPPRTTSGLTSTTSVPLYWVRYGEPGTTPLLVLHGGPGADHGYLLPQMLRLAAGREVTFYDQRGGGRSRTDDREPVGWRDHVADLSLVASELVPRPFDLLGYSWGGLLALLYLLDAPGAPRPERVVLVDPAPMSRRHRAQFEAEFARRLAAPELRALRDELAVSGLRERDPERYRKRLFELGVAAYFADPSRAHDLTPFRVVARVQDSVWDSLGDYDLLPRLNEVRLPVLIVHGRQDPIPPDSSERATRALPNAHLVTLEDCGHVPYVESPDALFSSIDAFLTR